MSKNSRFRGPFEKQHGKSARGLFKSSSIHFYYIYWSLPSALSWKKSLLLTWKTSGLLINTLAANEKYPVLNREYLTIPIQMELSQKQKTFSESFADFLKSYWNFEPFEKKKSFIAFVFSKLQTFKTWFDKCLKSPVLEDLFASNTVNVPEEILKCITSPLSCSLITAKFIELEKVSLIDIKNLRTAC